MRYPSAAQPTISKHWSGLKALMSKSTSRSHAFLIHQSTPNKSNVLLLLRQKCVKVGRHCHSNALNSYMHTNWKNRRKVLLRNSAFSTLTLLVGRQEEHPECKIKWRSIGVVICLRWGANRCIWSSWCHCIPKPHHLLSHLNPDSFYLSGASLSRMSWKRGH